MNNIENKDLKNEVHNYWDNQACGTWFTDNDKYTKEYFEDIEESRYRISPEIFNFAQFTRFRDKKLLEVGIGAATDFLQWVRAGTKAYGLDLTEEAIEHARHRLSIYGLEAEQLVVGDSENLPFDDNFFDIVYSWGVIHHTPDTNKAMNEIIRVLKPGGTGKIMLYHRHSVLSYLFWIKHALLKGKPWISLKQVLWNNMESIGTKAYTRKEVSEMLGNSVTDVDIKPVLTYYDSLGRFSAPLRLIAKIISFLLGGDRAGWFILIQFIKK